MPSLPASSRSLWRQERPPPHPALEGDRAVDVVVVGAGITGLATAVRVAAAGARVLVVEDRTVGAGATGYSTAKITALHGTKYSDLVGRHGVEVAARYGAAQQAAVAWLRPRAPGFEEESAFTYATDDDSLRVVEAEAAACAAAGLDTRFVEAVDLPFATRGAVALDGQGQVDPMPLLGELVKELETHGGAVVENTRVTGIRDGRRRACVRTTGGEIACDWVVVATGLPFLDRGLFFARTEPMSSYVIAARLPGRPPAGMHLSATEPVRSVRTAPDPTRPGERLLLVGGEGHKTGADPHPYQRYEALLRWATGHFGIDEVLYRWSAEDFVPDDGLPFVGPVWPFPTRVLVATGYAKWGFTNGVAAANVLSSHITGTDRPDHAEDWDTRRADVLRGARHAVRANTDVARKLVGGWVGAVARTRSFRPTVSAPDNPAGHRVSAVCTHLGGIVRWNDGDRCWDCPLHGSRFAADGQLTHGPATRDLPHRAM